jgi:hypothetical protein
MLGKKAKRILSRGRLPIPPHRLVSFIRILYIIWNLEGCSGGMLRFNHLIKLSKPLIFQGF